MTTAIVCAAILAAMLFLLGLNASRLRRTTAKTGGDQFPTDPASPMPERSDATTTLVLNVAT